MITRIEVDGFKSLRGFAVDLEPFTVLIGPNSAGKSNVLEALALLSRLASMPIVEAFKQGRGKSIDQFSRHGGEVATAIRFAVEFLEYGPYPAREEFQSRFRYELSIERRKLHPSFVDKLVVGDERLRAIRREEDTWILAHAEFAAYARYADAGKEVITRGPPHPLLVKSHTELAMGFFDFDGGLGRANLVKENLERCRMLDPGAAHLGEPSERIDSGDLTRDASNLPTVLAEARPNVIGEIRAALASLVPGVASFDVRLAGDEILLDFELSGGDLMPARLVSSGTLRILALLTALQMRPRPYMLCIEEPENGIYPGRLRALLEVFREATTRDHEEETRERYEESQRVRGTAEIKIEINQLPVQILLTTHSPVALAALRAHPQHLRFIDMVRRNGERVTRVRSAGKPAAGEGRWLTVSPREIEALMRAVESEESA